MTGALYANTNLDMKENQGVRERMIAEMNENLELRFDEVIQAIYGANEAGQINDLDKDDPFLKSMKLEYETNDGE
jgi:hypothetical protein